MQVKIKTWLKRYIPAEIFAALCTVSLGLLTQYLFHNSVLTAIGGDLGEFIGYYGTILFNDLRKHNHISSQIVLHTVREMFFEFGIGEFMDSFLIRPFSLYIFPLWLHNISLGLLVGKIVADIIFYIPTIISYEIRSMRKQLK